jgi:glycosyltransferase involved in cell wall biosynthesis
LIVDGETGWLVDPDPEALATALAQCLSDLHTLEQAGMWARQRALAHFGAERFAAQLQTALQLNDPGEG